MSLVLKSSKILLHPRLSSEVVGKSSAIVGSHRKSLAIFGSRRKPSAIFGRKLSRHLQIFALWRLAGMERRHKNKHMQMLRRGEFATCTPIGQTRPGVVNYLVFNCRFLQGIRRTQAQAQRERKGKIIIFALLLASRPFSR